MNMTKTLTSESISSSGGGKSQQVTLFVVDKCNEENKIS